MITVNLSNVVLRAQGKVVEVRLFSYNHKISAAIAVWRAAFFLFIFQKSDELNEGRRIDLKWKSK